MMDAPATTPAKAPPFTSANAREMQAKAVAARLRNIEAREAERLAALVKAQTPPQGDDYASVLLTRVRVLLDDVDERLAKATDAQDIERLARASNVLSERWRILAGIPLPGSRRPGKERAERVELPEPL